MFFTWNVPHKVCQMISLQVFDEARDNTHRRTVQGSEVQILWQDGEQTNSNDTWEIQNNIWFHTNFLIHTIFCFRLNTANWRIMSWFTLERSLSSVLTVITGRWVNVTFLTCLKSQNCLRCIQRSNLRIHMRGVHKKELPRLVFRCI